MGNVHPIFDTLVCNRGRAACEPRTDLAGRLAKHVLPAKSEDRDDAAQLLAAHYRMVAAAADRLVNLRHYEDTLTEPLYGWARELNRIRREMMAARIILEAGYGIGVPLPDDAAPALQGLIHCREDCPSPVYDYHYVVRVRDGRAFVEHAMTYGGYDKHFWEYMGGAPLPPTPMIGRSA